jgi:hypothetical protein
MTPGTYNIEIYRGDSTLETVFTFGGLTADLASVQMDIRPVGITSVLIRRFSSAAGDFTINDPVTGVVTLAPYRWEGAAGVYAHDIQLTQVDGVVQTYLRGSFTVIQDITQDD